MARSRTIRGGALSDFAFDPRDDNRVYITSNMVGVFVSDDAADYWQWSSYGATKQNGGGTKWSIYADYRKAGRWYASGALAAFRSDDDGRTWRYVGLIKQVLIFLLQKLI